MIKKNLVFYALISFFLSYATPSSLHATLIDEFSLLTNPLGTETWKRMTQSSQFLECHMNNALVLLFTQEEDGTENMVDKKIEVNNLHNIARSLPTQSILVQYIILFPLYYYIVGKLRKNHVRPHAFVQYRNTPIITSFDAFYITMDTVQYVYWARYIKPQPVPIKTTIITGLRQTSKNILMWGGANFIYGQYTAPFIDKHINPKRHPWLNTMVNGLTYGATVFAINELFEKALPSDPASDAVIPTPPDPDTK